MKLPYGNVTRIILIIFLVGFEKEITVLDLCIIMNDSVTKITRFKAELVQLAGEYMVFWIDVVA